MTYEERCDFVIVGGGPAGSMVALLLSSASFNVIQVILRRSTDLRPHEVITPAARRILKRHGVPEPNRGVGHCRGVLSYWSSENPEFHDYELREIQPAMAIVRPVFHSWIHGVVREKGVRIITVERVFFNQVENAEDGILMVEIGGQVWSIRSGLILDASGRNGNLAHALHGSRCTLDRQFAYWVPVRTIKHQECLILESGEDGWWYVTPNIAGNSQLVYMTDADLFRATDIDSKRFLSCQLEKTWEIKAFLASIPTFVDLKGLDARFSFLKEASIGGWVAVGDKALSLDPLSGYGVMRAFEGAEVLAQDIIENGTVGSSYTNWLKDVIALESKQRREMYSRVRNEFAENRFWARRVDIGEESKE